MVAPVTNPPAPDVEAIAAQVVKQLWTRPRPLCRDCADEAGVCPTTGEACDPWKIIASALTAHTASLQARVEEWKAEANAAHEYAGKVVQEQARLQERVEELEEAAETAIAEIDSGAPFTAADVLRAALRPADEPVTQREM